MVTREKSVHEKLTGTQENNRLEYSIGCEAYTIQTKNSVSQKFVKPKKNCEIKAAQIREELQRKGDELDSKIRIVEREMSALDSTLRHVVGANSKFRSGFQAADMNSKEGKKMITMKKRVKASGNVLFKKRKEVQRLTNDIEDVKVRSVRLQCSNAHSNFTNTRTQYYEHSNTTLEHRYVYRTQMTRLQILVHRESNSQRLERK